MNIINVKIKDLKPHPLNEEYYDNENSDNNNNRYATLLNKSSLNNTKIENSQYV